MSNLDSNASQIAGKSQNNEARKIADAQANQKLKWPPFLELRPAIYKVAS